MRYFHRTSLPIDEVLQEADRFLGGRLETTGSSDRSRAFRGAIGVIDIDVKAEGGHYTLVTAGTDQVTESEADKLVKRFMGTIHCKHERSHQLRGAY